MTADTNSIRLEETISFLNRDHIVLVTIGEGEIIVTTIAGTTITVPASGATLEKFVDDLASSVQSNFVAVAGEPRVIVISQQNP